MDADIGALTVSINGGGLADYPPGATFGPRTSHDHEFVWLVSGAAQWEVDGIEVALPNGSVALAREGQRDRFVWDPASRTRHGYVHFHLQDPTGVLGEPDAWPLMADDQGEGVVRPLLRHVLALIDRQTHLANDLAEHALRHALLAFVLAQRALQPERHGAELHPAVAAMWARLRRRWADGVLSPVPVEELARAADCSTEHLVRVVKRELGVPPARALRLLRLDHAVQQLERSEEPIARIAANCGFDDPYHFSRSFRQVYGCSPRAMRQRLRAGGNRPASALVRNWRRLALPASDH